jgi:prepilin-type N-terminal cleavage/methylation domain-containing protein/prepilin-type processing-associated H-X9-DG protein
MTLSRRPTCGAARAFTLVELLAVIGIIGLLVGLTLPAIQKVRDAGYRTVCRNNLKQIGLALHQYHDAAGAFPPGMSYRNGNDPRPFMSWHARILPYVEQEPLWRQTEAAFVQDRDFLNNPPHVGLGTPIKLYGCPSDPRTFRANKFGMAMTSYVGVEGLSQDVRNGVLHLDSRVSVAEITDGTSQTLMVGERPPSRDEILGWWYAGHGQGLNGSAEMIMGVREIRTLLIYVPLCVRGPYEFGPGTITDDCSVFHFWSLHPGGAHFLFADGAVRFLRYSAASVMPALASRNGGESDSLPD